MDTKQQSNVGDWLFMAGALALVCGWLGYESIDTINAWLMATQAPVQADGGALGAWLAANWGLIALIAAMIVAGVKWALSQRGGAVGNDGGPVVTYRRYRFVNVKLVR